MNFRETLKKKLFRNFSTHCLNNLSTCIKSTSFKCMCGDDETSHLHHYRIISMENISSIFLQCHTHVSLK